MVTHSDISLINLDRYMVFVWTDSAGKADEVQGDLRAENGACVGMDYVHAVLSASRGAQLGKAGKDKWTSWEVYEAPALMEHRCNKAMVIASRIFEKELGLSPDEVELVLQYLGPVSALKTSWAWLTVLALDARALFERIVGNFPIDRPGARRLQERWARSCTSLGI
jgi:hypothetical protein